MTEKKVENGQTMNAEELHKRLADFDTINLHGPVSEIVILAAEKELGIQFPPQYRSFLSIFGCGGVDSEGFIGLGGPDYLNVAKLAVRLRGKANPLPSNLLPLRNDGFGNYDCLNMNHYTYCGECAVVQWNHEGGKDQQCERISETFDAWLDSILLLIERDR